MDPQIQRRPVPVRTHTGLSLLPPAPPALRYTRSATNLRAAHNAPSSIIHNKGELPVDFVVEDLPTPSLSPQPTHEIRRVKSSSALAADIPKDSSNKWKAVLGEAQYFAGGLVSRPAESTSHFSIIRHSHALVWYRGPSTSVSVTVLSDYEIPAGRTVWLQKKGFSGNMGMGLKALAGRTNDWIDVTPVTKATVEALSEVDERGVQRDLNRFAKKGSGRLSKHVPRETLVVRIPAAANDGYFRLLLADGKKTLCGSPVFRVASTTTDISIMRGASLSTMPLEVGVKVASTVGQQFAKRYAGAASLVVQNKLAKTAFGQVKKIATAGVQVTSSTGLDGAVAESWQKNKSGKYEDNAMFQQMGDMPVAPFPVVFEGRVARGSGMSMAELGIPSANVKEVRDEIKSCMRGVFAAWACVVLAKGLEDVSHDWHEAIVSVGPLRYAPPNVVVKNRITVHFIHDFDGATFFDARVKLIMMGWLHAPLDIHVSAEKFVKQHVADSMMVLACLGREGWEVESAVRQKSLGERLDGVTGAVQGGVERVPLHRVGIRSEIGVVRDRGYGNGGLWIPR